MDEETRELKIKRLIREERMARSEAEFVMAIELGEIKGDVIEVNDEDSVQQTDGVGG